MTEDEEVIRWSTSDEGQFFERKSAFERSSGQPRRRNAREIAWDIVETLAAMANADGGELVVGIEDNGDLTGVPHPNDRLTLLRRAGEQPQYVTPPLRFRVQDIRTSSGALLLHFSIDWSPQVHQLADGRYLLRVGDTNTPFNAQRIEALKSTKEQGLTERSFPPGATLDDLDLGLVRSLVERLGGGSQRGTRSSCASLPASGTSASWARVSRRCST